MKLHSKLRTSPAMAASISNMHWDIDDVVEIEEANIDRTRIS